MTFVMNGIGMHCGWADSPSCREGRKIDCDAASTGGDPKDGTALLRHECSTRKRLQRRQLRFHQGRRFS